MNDLLLYSAVGVTFFYAFANGFHDGGNVIATVICSRSMHPMKALVLATVAEFIGPLILGTAVAHTVAGSVLDVKVLEYLKSETVYLTIVGALAGAILWNVVTWFLRLPSSSSHALIGGLIGAGLVSMGSSGVVFHKVLKGVVLPLLLSPLVGLFTGFTLFSVIKILFAGANRSAGKLFTILQEPTMFLLAASHGSNDAQKSMGVIALLLAAGTEQMSGKLSVPQWAVIGCAAFVALGLAVGGWRIVKTVGYGICRLEPVHSFASQLAASSVILVASLLGGPVSTVQVVSSSVMGVGASRRFSGVHWGAAVNIAYAWLLTVPISGALGACACRGLQAIIAWGQ